MKKLSIIFISFILLLSSSCSTNKSNINTISVKETGEHFNDYIDKLYDYKKNMDVFDWNNEYREGTIILFFKEDRTSVNFNLYNQLPDELSPFSKKNDDGYEKYKVSLSRCFQEADKICNLDNSIGDVVSIILSNIIKEKTTPKLIMESIEAEGVNKNVIKNSENLENEFNKKLYDKEININGIWCNYRLYYRYGGYQYFTEEIVFGGMEDDNYTKIN